MRAIKKKYNYNLQNKNNTNVAETKVNKVKFSSLGELATNTSSGRKNEFKKEDINNYLANVAKYNKELRDMSDNFFYSNGVYKNIVTSFATLPTLNNMVVATEKTLSRKTDKAYTTYLTKINDYVSSLDLKITTRNILKSVCKYGAYIGYERTEGNEVCFQSLPLDYVRIKSKIGHEYLMEFDFKYFDKFFDKNDLEFAFSIYPKEFKSLYNKSKADKKSKNPEWQILDIKKTICILAEDDSPYFIPMFSGMFDSLLNAEDYKDLVKMGKELDILKLIIQKVPLSDKGEILIEKDDIAYAHEQLINILPKGANGLTTPLQIEDVPFANQSQAVEDLLNKGERGIYTSSGWSSALFSNDGAKTGLQANVEIVTSNIYSILEKIESMFNRRFKMVVNSKNYEFRLSFFRMTNLNIDAVFSRMYKMLEIGGAIEPLINVLGMDTISYITLLGNEAQLGIKDLLVVPKSMHTQSSKDTETKGVPKKEEGELTQEGQASRENGDKV